MREGYTVCEERMREGYTVCEEGNERGLHCV